MSISALNWARTAMVKSVYERALLVDLADRADRNGEAYPHLCKLAATWCCSVRQMERAAKACEGRGQLARERIIRDNGTMAGYRYRLPVSVTHPVTQSEPDHESPPPDCQSGQTGLVVGSPPDCESGQEPLKHEPGESGAKAPASPARTRARAARVSPSEHPAFAAFWDAYPRKVGKGAARKAYTAAVRDGATPEQLLAAVQTQRFDDREGGRFIKHPATWLHQECWLDEAPARSRSRQPILDFVSEGVPA